MSLGTVLAEEVFERSKFKYIYNCINLYNIFIYFEKLRGLQNTS